MKYFLIVKKEELMSNNTPRISTKATEKQRRNAGPILAWLIGGIIALELAIIIFILISI